MSVEDAAELARRAIYHATFRDGASGGVVSGRFHICAYTYMHTYILLEVVVSVPVPVPLFQSIMLDQMGGRSFLGMMLGSFITHIIQSKQHQLNKKWLKFLSLENTNFKF